MIERHDVERNGILYMLKTVDDHGDLAIDFKLSDRKHGNRRDGGNRETVSRRGTPARQPNVAAYSQGRAKPTRKFILSNLPEDLDEAEIFDMFEGCDLEKVYLKPGKYAVLTFGQDFLITPTAKPWWDGRGVLRDHWIKVREAKW